MNHVRCRNEEEGLALTHLLDCCLSWKMDVLFLTGQVGKGIWEGVGRAADRGTVHSRVKVDRDVLRRGVIEDVRRVWECTGKGEFYEGWRSYWQVTDGETWALVGRREGMFGKWGWGEIEKLTM